MLVEALVVVVTFLIGYLCGYINCHLDWKRSVLIAIKKEK